MTSDDEGPIIKMICPTCGFGLQKLEARMPAHALNCPKCGDFMKRMEV